LLLMEQQFSLLPVEFRSDSKSCNQLRKWF